MPAQRARTFLLFVATLAGCGDIIGLDGYTDEDGAADATQLDAPSGDAKADVKLSDAGSDVVATDAEAGCLTPANTCVPPLPGGWAWAVYDPDTRPACATGYGTPTDVAEGIDAGPATCGCGCNTTNPNCNAGTLTITGGNNGTCSNTANETDPADAGCNLLATSFTLGGGSSIAVKPPAPVGGSCTATTSDSVPEAGVEHQGRTCAYAGTAGGGCSGGNVCVPNPTPFGVCVSQAGLQTCPSAFPNQHLVGTTLADTRSCSACTCAFDAGACTGTVTMTTNNGCTNNKQQIPADGGCMGVGAHTYVSYNYVSGSTASCAASPASADGGVVFSDLTTVCCQ
jgi:hypothetical protein